MILQQVSIVKKKTVLEIGKKYTEQFSDFIFAGKMSNNMCVGDFNERSEISATFGFA